MLFSRSSTGPRVHLIATLACLLGMTACDSSTTVCTQIGCESGLTVHLSNLPTVPFRVELAARSGVSQPVYVYDCAAGVPCGRDLFFPGFTADQAVVTVRVGTAARTTSISRVTYERVRPNGPNCPPECLQATVNADVPA